MADHPLDGKMEKLVALLYGELPPDEAKEMRERLLREPDLRAAWEELTAARSFLEEAAVEEEAPSFVFLNDARSRRPRARGLRWIPALAPWAAAAAALVVAVVSWNEARVARHEAGRAHLAAAASAEQAAASAGSSERSATLAASLQMRPTAPAAQPAGGDYVKREDLDAYTVEVGETMTALLNEYGRRRDEDLANVMQVALSELAERQGSDYRDLRDRIDNVALGLAQEQFKTNLQVEYLMQEEQRPQTPARNAP